MLCAERTGAACLEGACGAHQAGVPGDAGGAHGSFRSAGRRWRGAASPDGEARFTPSPHA